MKNTLFLETSKYIIKLLSNIFSSMLPQPLILVLFMVLFFILIAQFYNNQYLYATPLKIISFALCIITFSGLHIEHPILFIILVTLCIIILWQNYKFLKSGIYF